MLPSLSERPTRNDTKPRQRELDLSAKWDTYWQQSRDVELPERGGVFRVYEAGVDEAPQFMLLHGGGYTGLTWSLIADQLKDKFKLWGIDLRGHGCTTTQNDADLSAETLTEDVVAVVESLMRPELPVVLVGHSMGAAIAIRCAATERISTLQGIMVIDVVEGTALASLPYMKSVIERRPSSFHSLESAVDWALKTKMCRNVDSACISVPGMLIESNEGWKWRTALLPSEPYWTGWYQGLSALFLSLSIPKLICLAGTDRLDRALTVGQMQGKFQLSLMPTVGHAIHEDDPDRVAELISQFIKKFRIGAPNAGIL